MIKVVETARDIRWVKRAWPPSHLSQLKKELTLIPAKTKGYSVAPPLPIAAFKETTFEIVTPRAWATTHLAHHHLAPSLSTRTKELEALTRRTLAFTFQLRPFQDRLTTEAMALLLRPPYSVLLEVGCGKGKTIMALYLAAQLQLPTLILVQDSFLLNQWIERITQCLPSASVGRLQQNTNDVGRADIVIGMVQTVVSRYKDPAAFASVGLLIVDECHRMGSPLFSQVLQVCMAPHLIGLSATPERQDGMHALLSWFTGPTLRDVEEVFPIVHVRRIPFPAAHHITPTTNFQGMPNVVQMLTDLAQCPARQALLLASIATYLIPGRVLLVLSHRRDQLTHLDTALQASHPHIRVGYYVGGMKQKDLDHTAATATVLLATYQMAQQALDIPRLNTLIMATPMKDMRQSIGRITRLTGDKGLCPVVVDLVDQGIPCFPRHAATRAKLYKERKYRVEDTAASAAASAAHEVEDEDEDEDEKKTKKRKMMPDE